MSEQIHENGHRFDTGEAIGFGPGSVLHGLYVCLDCGTVRRGDGKNSPCKGKVRVELRGRAPASEGEQK